MTTRGIARDIARNIGISHTLVSLVLRGKRWNPRNKTHQRIVRMWDRTVRKLRQGRV